MKNLILLFALTVLCFACTETLDKPLNKKDLPEVVEILNSDMNYTPMERKYVVDNLTSQMGFIEMASAAVDMTGSEMPTFRTMIMDLSHDYDSIKTAKLTIKENNKKLDRVIEMASADAISIDEYKAYLTFNLRFNNEFEKDILYAIVNYKYVDKYDSEYFDKNLKITDQVANNFEGEAEVSAREEYNDVSKFLYQKMPIRARKELRDQLGAKKADEKVKKDFLMEGLQFKTVGVVFKDKTELTYQNADWEYMD